MSPFVVICLIVVIDWAKGDGDYNPAVPSKGCENFTMNVPVGPFLPSETVYVNATCSSVAGNARCPNWKVLPLEPKDYIVENVPVKKNNSCGRYMAIQMWNPIHWSQKTNTLSLLFQYPVGVSVKQITIRKSGNGERCVDSSDCWIADQECSSLTRTCGCPKDQVFIENAQKCAPTITLLFSLCDYTEQCKGLEAICSNDQCSCPNDYMYVADIIHHRCLYRNGSLGGGCDRSYYNDLCRDNYTRCDNGLCVCDYGYQAVNGNCQKN